MNTQAPLLAILIPAYKTAFLRETLNSIAKQTNKNFTVYIGDDASPADIETIVSEFEPLFPIQYKKFANNLGSTNLAAHWDRCMELVKEEWVWLFSDDDKMGDSCVDRFYDFIATNKDADLLHFDVDIIDQDGLPLVKVKRFPDHLSSLEFYTGRFLSSFNSFAVEYIFRKKLYQEKGKFEKYDLAWNADDATWIKFAAGKGIHTITGARVQWRYSTINISSLKNSPEIINRKVNASILFVNWTRDFLELNKKTDTVSDFRKLNYAVLTLVGGSTISIREKFLIVFRSLKKMQFGHLRLRAGIFLSYLIVKHKAQAISTQWHLSGK